MKFSPVERTLKNGKLVTIRMATKKDAEGLMQTISRYIIDSEYLLTTIDEFNPTLRDQKLWIETLNEKRNCLLLIATHEKKIIGNIDLKGESKKKVRHNALLGIGMVKEWQGLGLGKILMEYAIDWARENLTLEILWLHVFANNEQAKALYKKMGFEEVSIQKNFIKNIDGTYSDNIIMKMGVK